MSFYNSGQGRLHASVRRTIGESTYQVYVLARPDDQPWPSVMRLDDGALLHRYLSCMHSWQTVTDVEARQHSFSEQHGELGTTLYEILGTSGALDHCVACGLYAEHELCRLCSRSHVAFASPSEHAGSCCPLRIESSRWMSDISCLSVAPTPNIRPEEEERILIKPAMEFHSPSGTPSLPPLNSVRWTSLLDRVLSECRGSLDPVLSQTQSQTQNLAGATALDTSTCDLPKTCAGIMSAAGDDIGRDVHRDVDRDVISSISAALLASSNRLRILSLLHASCRLVERALPSAAGVIE